MSVPLDEGISGDYVRSDQLYGDRPVFIKAQVAMTEVLVRIHKYSDCCVLLYIVVSSCQFLDSVAVRSVLVSASTTIKSWL